MINLVLNIVKARLFFSLNMTPVAVLFVCLGNICRSPMAEGVFLDIIKKQNASNRFKVDSAGTAGYHQGEQPDSRMMFHASKRGYTLNHRSRKFLRSDFDNFDYIVVMDDNNYENVKSLANSLEEEAKIHRMVDFSSKFQATHIPDPYYGGAEGFDHVIDLLEDACDGLFSKLNSHK